MILFIQCSDVKTSALSKLPWEISLKDLKPKALKLAAKVEVVMMFTETDDLVTLKSNWHPEEVATPENKKTVYLYGNHKEAFRQFRRMV